MTLHTSLCIALRNLVQDLMYVESQWSNSQYLESTKRPARGHTSGGIVLIRLIEVGSLNVGGTFRWQPDKRVQGKNLLVSAWLPPHLLGQSSCSACDFLNSVAVAATTSEFLPW